MTLVQASIAEGGGGVVIASDRLLSRTLSHDLPTYEFEANQPKIIGLKRVAIGFAGSQLYAEEITDLVKEQRLQDFDTIVDEVSEYIADKRDERISNEIKSRTGIEDTEEFFENPNLPIPNPVRGLIYKMMGEKESPIINANCVVAGFDEAGDARLNWVDVSGDAIEATNFGVISIGSGSPFSTIYFDQNGYGTDCGISEAVVFNFEAKKWAEAPSGVGSKTDIISIWKEEVEEEDDEEVIMRKFTDGGDLIGQLETYYEEQHETMREERVDLRESVAEEVSPD